MALLLCQFEPFEEVVLVGLVLLLSLPVELGQDVEETHLEHYYGCFNIWLTFRCMAAHLGNDVFMVLVLEERRRRQLGGQIEERGLGHFPLVPDRETHDFESLCGGGLYEMNHLLSRGQQFSSLVIVNVRGQYFFRVDAHLPP